VQEETSDFMEKCIREFDAAIVALPERQRKSFNRALFLWPKLETDTKFKLMFLRADNYDSEKAASRMAKYYDQKRVLFGEEKLVKKITMDDLNPEGQEVFTSGFMVTLPLKDQTGRPLFLVDSSKADFTRMSADTVVSDTVSIAI
jgi:hypothetical protein